MLKNYYKDGKPPELPKVGERPDDVVSSVDRIEALFGVESGAGEFPSAADNAGGQIPLLGQFPLDENEVVTAELRSLPQAQRQW